MKLIDLDAFREDYQLKEHCEGCERYGKKDCDYPSYSARDFCGWLDDAPIVETIPIGPLAVWLAGYHVSPPEYALKETGAINPIDQLGTIFTPNQIATAWAYHLKKLMESGLMEDDNGKEKHI